MLQSALIPPLVKVKRNIEQIIKTAKEMGAGGGVQVYRRTGQTCRIYKSTYAIAKRGCIRKILIRMQMCAYMNISLNSTHLALISIFFF